MTVTVQTDHCTQERHCAALQRDMDAIDGPAPLAPVDLKSVTARLMTALFTNRCPHCTWPVRRKP